MCIHTKAHTHKSKYTHTSRQTKVRLARLGKKQIVEWRKTAKRKKRQSFYLWRRGERGREVGGWHVMMTLTLTSAFLLSKVLAAAMTNREK